jgi:hypothetical protein
VSHRFRVGDVQAAALEIYVLDPVHAEAGDHFCGSLRGSVLEVTDLEPAWRRLVDAANDADGDGDWQLRDALTALASRVLRRAA